MFILVKRPNCLRLYDEHVAKHVTNLDFENCMADGDGVDDELFGLYQCLINGH